MRMSEQRTDLAYVPECAFVTGATSGFGVAIARRLATLGVRLIIAGRRTERLRDLREELTVPVHPIIICVDSVDRQRRAARMRDSATRPAHSSGLAMLLDLGRIGSVPNE